MTLESIRTFSNTFFSKNVRKSLKIVVILFLLGFAALGYSEAVDRTTVAVQDFAASVNSSFLDSK